MTEDEMVGWYHRLSGCEFEQTQGDSEGQGSLVCCSPWGRKESDMTERPNTSNSPGGGAAHSENTGDRPPASPHLVQEDGGPSLISQGKSSNTHSLVQLKKKSEEECSKQSKTRSLKAREWFLEKWDEFQLVWSLEYIELVAEQFQDRVWGKEKLIREQSVDAGEATSEGLL